MGISSEERLCQIVRFSYGCTICRQSSTRILRHTRNRNRHECRRIDRSSINSNHAHIGSFLSTNVKQQMSIAYSGMVSTLHVVV